VSRACAAAASLAIGAALCGVAFVAGGGTELGPTAAVEIALLIGAGMVLALVLVAHPRRPAPPDRASTARVPPEERRGDGFRGVAPLVLLMLFAALTAASLGWSIAPDATLEEAARLLAYLAVFAVAVVAGNLAPRATPALLGGMLIAGSVVCAWALATRVWPGALAESVFVARLSEPFGYWNALGAMAAVCVPAALWLGSRRHAGPVSTALAYPALGLLALTVLLTQSRGALAAMAIGAILWLALVPLRLRSAPVIVLAALAVAPVAAWALSKPAFTQTLAPLSAREAIAGDFGLRLLTMTVALFAAGLVVERLAARRPLSLRTRRRTGIALIGAVCLLPLAGLTSVAMSDRGLGDTVSDRVEELTSETQEPPGGAERLGSVESTRGDYWRQAGQVFGEHRLEGTGASSFEIASLRYRKDNSRSGHAHGFIPQTMADLGLLGTVLAVALLVAWLVAARRSTGLLRRREARPPWSPERATLVALALCAVVFGIQSAIDWTWFFFGPAVAALLAAGFVAGHPRPAVSGHAANPAGASPPGPAPQGARERLRRLGEAASKRPERLVAAAAVLTVAVLCSWVAWLPAQTARASDEAQALADRGELRAAADAALRARESGPYSVDPLFARAAVLEANRQPDAAYRTYQRAALEHPRDPATWIELARYELELGLPQRAQMTLGRGLETDPQSSIIPPLLTQAVEESKASEPTPAAAPERRAPRAERP
jgi:hypothetical protein